MCPVLLLTPATVDKKKRNKKKKKTLSVGASVLRELRTADVRKIYTFICAQLTPKNPELL